MQRGRPGPTLPYDLLAGVVPCQKGWLVASGKLVGISLHPETPTVVASFAEVIDHIPSYVIVAVHTPIGLSKKWTERGRTCDREARDLVGWPHLGAIASPPGRGDFKKGASKVGNVTTRRMAHAIAEVDEQMEPYRQRSVYAVHPELSFYQLNEDVPPKHSKASAAGIRERRELLLRRLNGMERVLDSDIPGATQSNVLDAAVSLWTARRIIAKAATRLPIDPEWDDNGLRMEWVR